MEISFANEFLAMCARLLAEQSDGEGIEFDRLLELTNKYAELTKEFSDGMNKVLRRMRDNGRISNALFEFLSNPNNTEADLNSASKKLRSEYNEYYIMNLKGKIDRSEMKNTFIKAIKLRKELLSAMADILPNLFNKYMLPEKKVEIIHRGLTYMQGKLESIILVGLS